MMAKDGFGLMKWASALPATIASTSTRSFPISRAMAA